MIEPSALDIDIGRLSRLLGDVVEEQEGADLRRLVDRTRRHSVRARRGDAAARRSLQRELDGLDAARIEVVIRGLLLHFHLANLAEERHRIRVLEERARRRSRTDADDTLAGVVGRLRADGKIAADPRRAADAIRDLRIHPVLTAHPTEARRRTTLMALGRLARLLASRDDPRLAPGAAGAVDDRIREELTILWRTADIRAGTPAPLDEVRTALAFFDATLYSLVPTFERSVATALGADPRDVPAILRWGSWIGGHRDGHPGVTAETTEAAARIQADHVLRGH